MSTPMASAWVGALRALIEEWPEVVVFAGPGASDLASACSADGGPPLSAEAGGVSILSRSAPPSPVGALSDLPETWAGLVVLRSAWRDRTAVGPMLLTAARALRRGGRLFAGELDVARLVETTTVRYPSRLLFSVRPDLTSRVRSTTIGRAMLATEAVRAGLGDVAIVNVEEERAIFPSAEAYWRYARSGGWPALAWLPAEEAERALEDAAGGLSRIAPIGPVVDRVPFVAVTGIRR